MEIFISKAKNTQNDSKVLFPKMIPTRNLPGLDKVCPIITLQL